MVCEKCGEEFSEDFRKDRHSRKLPMRFCSRKCSNSRKHSEEQNKLLSDRMKGKSAWNKGVKNPEELKKFTSSKRRSVATSIEQVSSRTAAKIMKRLKVPCSFPGCGWFVEGVVGDIHHIIPKKHGGSDDHSNLTYVCPNCHRELHSGTKDISRVVLLSDYIGDSWREVYYSL